MSTVKGFRVGNENMLYQDPNITEEFSENKTYNIGDYVINPVDGKLYRCTTAITTAEGWNDSHWMQTKIAKEVSNLNTSLNKGYYPNIFSLESLSFTEISGNIFKSNDLFATSGYLDSDGSITPSANYKTSGFASVKEGEIYYLFGTVQSGKQVARFAMTYDHGLNPRRYLSNTETITIENGEEYLRISGAANGTLGASLDPSRPTNHSAIIPLDVIEKETVSHIDNKI